jgi:hypothetical protein
MSEMPKKDQTSISQLKIAEILDKKGTPLKKQKIKINESSFINEMINKLIKEFSDYKTNINLLDILSPAYTSRAANIPRPQNSFMLFRKDYSKGLVNAKIPMSVGNSSILASKHWKSFSKKEKDFWYKLAEIAKEIHRINYPNYKFIPIKNQEKILETVNKQLQLMESTNEISESPSNECKLSCKSSNINSQDQSNNLKHDFVYSTLETNNDNSSVIYNDIASTSEICDSSFSNNNVNTTKDPSPMELDENFGINVNPDELYLLHANSVMDNNSNDINIFDSLIDPKLYNLFY